MGDIIQKFPCRSTPSEKPRYLRLYFDTGSPRTFVKQSIAVRMKEVSKLKTPIIFHGLGDGTFKATHTLSIHIKMLGIWIPHLCYVVPDRVLDPDYDILLGHDFMQIYNILINPQKRKVIISKSSLKMALKVRNC